MLQVAKCLDEGDDLQPVLLGHALQVDDVLRREAVEGARHLHRPSVGKHVLVLDEERVAAGATDQGELAGAQAWLSQGLVSVGYPQSYRVSLMVSELGLVDLDFRCSTILLGQYVGSFSICPPAQGTSPEAEFWDGNRMLLL